MFNKYYLLFISISNQTVTLKFLFFSSGGFLYALVAEQREVTMPEGADMINLSFLSEREQEMILEVLRRDEELRVAEEKRVR